MKMMQKQEEENNCRSLTKTKTKIINASIWHWCHSVERDFEIFRNCEVDIVNGLITSIIRNHPVQSIIDRDLFDCIIDANNALLLPGLMDAHIHVGLLGESQYFVDLGNCFSIEDLLYALSNHCHQHPSLTWLVGINWDQSKLGRYPDRKDLDSLKIKKPVFLWRACLHIGVANTLALSAAGVILPSSSNEIQPKVLIDTVPGGVIDLDSDGVPSGILRERATELIMSVMNKGRTFEDKMKFISEGLSICARVGLTSVQTNDESSVSVYQTLQGEGSLPLRVFLTPNYEDIHIDTVHGGLKTVREENGGSVVLLPHRAQGLEKSRVNMVGRDLGDLDTRLTIERLKIFSDGSLGADTAALRTDKIKDGEAASSYKGVLIHTSSSLQDMIATAARLHYRLEIHAIGDKSAEVVLDALSAFVNDVNLKGSHDPTYDDWRPILTHCQILGADLVEKMKALNAIANIQPSFVPTDMRWISNSGLSSEQLRYSYCWKTLLENGIHVAGGSDAPIESPSPFVGIHDAVFRSNRRRKREADAVVDEVFRPEESLTFSQALWMYTVEAAYAAHCEHVLGRIEEGYAADLVFVDPMIVNVDSSANSSSPSPLADLLHDFVPYMVMVGGKVVSTSSNTADQSGRPIIVKASSLLPPLPPIHTSTTQICMPLGDGAFIPGKGGRFGTGANLTHSSAPSCACALLGKLCGASVAWR